MLATDHILQEIKGHNKGPLVIGFVDGEECHMVFCF